VLVSNISRTAYGYSCFRPTGTKDWLVMFTVGGEGCVRHKDHVQNCRKNDLIILPPGITHDYFTPKGGNWNIKWAHFIPRTSWTSWLRLPKVADALLFLHISDESIQSRMNLAFDRLIADNRAASNSFREELGLNSLEEILLLAASASPREAVDSLDPRIGEILNLLSSNIQKSFSIQELAQTVCLSPSRLTHLFKEQTGDSILETLLKIRLRQSAKLLELTSRQVTEIAADVGFQSPDYFSSKFRQYFGENPTSYRKRHLLSQELGVVIASEANPTPLHVPHRQNAGTHDPVEQ
jgi:AraC family transcriptional regulator of arabinose operon